MGFFYKKKNKNSISITIDRKERKTLNRKNLDFLALLKVELSDSCFFSENGINVILKKLNGFDFFLYHPKSIIKRVYSDPFLTLEDKKRYGLNTRLKISREYFECIDKNVFISDNPNSIFERLLRFSYNRINNKYTLTRYRESGVQKVKIMGCDCTSGCSSICSRESEWLIDKVPLIPLKECDADICRASYSPVL